MGTRGLRDGIRGIGDAAESTKESLAALTSTATEGGREFELMVTAANSLATNIESVGRAIQGLGQNIPILAQFGETINFGTEVVTELLQTMTGIADVYYETMGAFDALSAGHRALYGDMYDLGTQFGRTFDEAKNFGLGILSVAGDIKGSDFGWLEAENLVESAKALSGNRVNMDKFSDSIVTSAGRFDLLTAATLQAGASGLETSDYFNTLSQAMIRQGLESQEAMEQLASFKDTAESTGISVKSISDTLTNLGNAFSKIGLSADFGRPLVKSFGDTINDMGLGIENATELASSLSNSLASLSTDYSTMFITAQRGNLSDMMGGGALGAGIQLQAKLLESEGNPEAQAKLGAEMATALRDTIASFSGGDITTVQEAAGNPALEAQFYTQQRLLQQMYNLDDQTAVRTLDLLDRMGKAVDSGNQDLAKSLGEDLQDMITKNDETFDEQRKTNAWLSALVSEAQATNEALFFLSRETVASPMRRSLNDQLGSGFEEFQKAMLSRRAEAEEAIMSARGNEKNLSEAMDSIINHITGASTDNPTDGMESISDNVSQMDNLISKIDDMISSNIDTNKWIQQMLNMMNSNTATTNKAPSVSPGGAGALSGN